MSEPNYLNIEINNAGYDELTDRVKYLDVEKYVSRSGAIVDKANDYYASVFRLVFDLDVPVFIGEMQVPSADGLSLIYSMTIRSTIGGVVTRGRAFLKLPYQAADVILHQTQPTNFYNAFWEYAQVNFALNVMVREAYADLIANGSAVAAAEIPFFSYDSSSGFFSLTCFPFPLYEYRNPPSGDRVEIFFNAASYPLIKGWDSYYLTQANELPNADGEDYQLLVYNQGTNYLPQPAAFITSMTPATPAATSLTATQSFPSALPSIVSINVLSDLPSAGEFVQSSTGSELAKILTDFKPDLSNTGGASIQYYNANFGDCRWVKLVGSGPISQVTVRIEAVDYLGVRHVLKLYSKSEQASMKIAFAPKELVENFEK